MTGNTLEYLQHIHVILRKFLSRNSEAFTSEYLENLEEIFPW